MPWCASEWPELDDREVHIWWTDARSLVAARPRAYELLDEAEQQRAARFLVERPRRLFVAGRYILRTALAAYSGVTPCSLCFVFSDHGKPRVAAPSAACDLGFNLSHSGEVVVLAVARHRDLGVDVERLRHVDKAERLAERFFAISEHAWLAACSEADICQSFFHIWTSKEAWLKAVGTGLATPLRQVEVDPDPRLPPRLLRIAGDPEAAERWSLTGFEPTPGYRGVVALPGRGWTLIVREFPG